MNGNMNSGGRMNGNGAKLNGSIRNGNENGFYPFDGPPLAQVLIA